MLIRQIPLSAQHLVVAPAKCLAKAASRACQNEKLLKECIDKRSNARGGGKDQEQSKQQQNRDHRDQPPQLALPQEIQELSYDPYIQRHTTEKVFH